MLTLSKGVKKPQTGDKGSVWMPGLETNAQILNDHTHNGSNSEKITSTDIIPVSATISSASWSSLGGGKYSQVVTIPNGKKMSEVYINFKTTDGHPIMLDCEAYPVGTALASATQYTVYCNDQITVTAHYLS